MLELLRDEHRAIERLLRILHAAVGERGDLPKRPELLVRAVEMLQNYAENFHQELEERELFPRLEREGVPRQGGPLEVLSAEHRLAKHYVDDMRSALARWSKGEESAWPELVETIQAYSMLLRAHIGKEEMVILPLAYHAFQGRTDELDQELEKAHLLQIDETERKEYERILTELEEELGLDSFSEDNKEESNPERLADAFLKRQL